MKLRRLFSRTIINTPWKNIKRVRKSKMMNFRVKIKNNPRRTEIERNIKTNREILELEGSESGSGASSVCSLQDLIHLAAREMEEKVQSTHSTQKQEYVEDSEVYEEMNFHARNDNDNEYMEMNFRKL